MPTLLDVKMRVPAGSVLMWNGWPHTDADYPATVMMPGPVASSVWATGEDGRWLCLKWHGRRQTWVDVTRDHAAVVDQRAAIVDAMVATELRLRARRYAFVPDEDHHRSRPGDYSPEGYDYGDHRRRQRELDHDLAVLARLRTRFWAELYPTEREDR